MRSQTSVDHPWCGPGVAEQGRLAAVEQSLRAPLADLGFEPSTHAWHPHVTVARVRRQLPPGLLRMIRDRRHDQYGALRVDRLDLISSDLGPSGPVYATLASELVGAKMNRQTRPVRDRLVKAVLPPNQRDLDKPGAVKIGHREIQICHVSAVTPTNAQLAVLFGQVNGRKFR